MIAFTRLRKKKAKEYERVQARILKKSKKKDEEGESKNFSRPGQRGKELTILPSCDSVIKNDGGSR